MTLSAELLRARVKALPTLPQAVHALRTAMADESTGMERVVGIVATDPALTMAALRLANSSFYGVSGRVATLRDAVQTLGLNTLSAAVMTAAVMASFQRTECVGFDVGGAWRHAVATALSAEALAVGRDVDAGTAYVAGLVHDIGRVALASHFPTEYAAVVARVAADDSRDETATGIERALLGLDHAEVGAMVAAHWRLSPVIVDAIAAHHALQPGVANGLHDVLHVADNVTHALGLSMSAAELVPPLSLEAWERVGLSPAEMQALFAQVEARMQAFPTAVAA
jgi:putative nucleotidyltransferase with HDIG domain